MFNYSLNNDTEKGSDQRERLKKSDFESFFRRYYAELCNFAFGYVNNRDIAEDIVQSIFINLWEQRYIWDDLDSAKGYLYKSVRNEALNYLKHEKVRRKAEAEVEIRYREWKSEQGQGSGTREKIEIIQKAVDKLPDRCSEIFRLSRESGLTYREIADTLKLSVKTVETQMGRALKSIRSFVGERLGLHIITILILNNLFSG